VEKFDECEQKWQKVPNMLTPRATFAALKTPDNTGILVLGGFNS